MNERTRHDLGFACSGKFHTIVCFRYTAPLPVFISDLYHLFGEVLCEILLILSFALYVRIWCKTIIIIWCETC